MSVKACSFAQQRCLSLSSWAHTLEAFLGERTGPGEGTVVRLHRCCRGSCSCWLKVFLIMEKQPRGASAHTLRTHGRLLSARLPLGNPSTVLHLQTDAIWPAENRSHAFAHACAHSVKSLFVHQNFQWAKFSQMITVKYAVKSAEDPTFHSSLFVTCLKSDYWLMLENTVVTPTVSESAAGHADHMQPGLRLPGIQETARIDRACICNFVDFSPS